VAGGKGGVGRSLIVANLGIQMARLGRRVTLADLDLGGASLHTFLGLSQPARTLDRLIGPDEVPLPSLLLDTSVPHLKLLAGVQQSPSPAVRTMLIERFLRQAPTLAAEVLVVDCGSGRSREVLDLFRSTPTGILVTAPEPAAVESVYLFAEEVLRRAAEETLAEADREKIEIARTLEEDGGQGRESLRAAVERLRAEKDPAADRVVDLVRNLRWKLLLNQVRSDSEAELARVLQSGFGKFFGVELALAGCVEYDLSVLQTVSKRRPLSQQYPNSPATQGIERAVAHLLSPYREEPADPPLVRDLAGLDAYRLLEVDPAASPREIQQTYQVLKRGYEAGSNLIPPHLSAAAVARVAERIEAAYRTLIFLESRTDYDRKMVSEGIYGADRIRSAAEHFPPGPEKPAAQPAPSPLPITLAEEAPASAPNPEPESADGGPVPGRGLPVTGATLRSHREARRLTLEAIVEKTKIRPAILEALEQERFQDLPAPVFLRGFLRQLASCLGLDPAVICSEYMARIPSTQPPPERRRR
jgi:flagellar biosynthesis protein FlhG